MTTVRDRLVHLKRTMDTDIDDILRRLQSQDGVRIPNGAMKLIEAAQDTGGKAKAFRNAVENQLDVSAYTTCSSQVKQAIRLITIMKMAARLIRYLIGKGGPIPEEMHYKIMAIMATELTKPNRCQGGYPADSTMDSAFGQLAFSLYKEYERVTRDRQRRFGGGCS